MLLRVLFGVLEIQVFEPSPATLCCRQPAYKPRVLFTRTDSWLHFFNTLEPL
jgi:hypothetical protein